MWDFENLERKKENQLVQVGKWILTLVNYNYLAILN